MNNSYTLVLSFDYNQISESLRYTVWQENNQRYPQQRVGRTAGTFNFTQGDRISVKVVGGYENGKDAPSTFNFTVQNCTLVFIKAPQVVDLSLFDPDNAVANVNFNNSMEKFNWPNGDMPAYQAWAVTSTEQFSVTAQNGQWKLSGYLSVEINGTTKMFYFDPESSAGDGTGVGHGGHGLP